MNVRGVFPTTASEWIAMTACYALVGLLFWMVTHPREVFSFATGFFA